MSFSFLRISFFDKCLYAIVGRPIIFEVTRCDKHFSKVFVTLTFIKNSNVPIFFVKNAYLSFGKFDKNPYIVHSRRFLRRFQLSDGPCCLSLFDTFVNILALIGKRSVFLSSRAGILTKVWTGDIYIYSSQYTNGIIPCK